MSSALYFDVHVQVHCTYVYMISSVRTLSLSLSLSLSLIVPHCVLCAYCVIDAAKSKVSSMKVSSYQQMGSPGHVCHLDKRNMWF